MSYSNGIISIETTGGVTYGVSVYDVQRALGRGTGDVGLLCSDQEWQGSGSSATLVRANRINKWAKNKPVRSSKLGLMTLADFQDVYFGLDVPIYGSGYITVLTDFLDSFASAYAYLPPRGKGGGTGGANEWYRLRDFEGYNVAAVQFSNEQGCSFPRRYDYGGVAAGGCNFTLSLNTGTGLHDGISIGDWKLGGSEGTAFSSMYFGLIFKHGTDTPQIVTATSTLASSGYTLNIADSGNDGLDGLATSYTYTVYPVLCTNSHSTLGNVGNQDQIVPLPVATFQFKQYPVSATVTYDMQYADAYQGASARLFVTATIGINSTGGYQSVSTNHLQLFRASSDSDTTGSQIGSTYDIGTITTADPVTFNPGGLSIDQFPAYVRIHLYNDSVSGMTLDYWVLVREDEF